MSEYNYKKIEKKWHKRWDNNKNSETSKDVDKPKYYILDMFPYPSGDGLHMGHTESYTASDIIYRFKKLQGYDVLHPQGFDSFGLPAENYAIKTGVHPLETTKKNTDNYIKQMGVLGLGHDFDHLIYTSDPSYYKWTQFLFGKFFENGLVEQKIDTINWCSSCNTGIANEQVENGKCERCKTEIGQREIPGWFFKITDFSEDLINDLGGVDWPGHTKKNQRAWIGKSEGALIKFKIKSSSSGDNSIDVFTTRPDTLFGATYMVVAPEHNLISDLSSDIKNLDEINKYVDKTKGKTEIERLENKDKTGVMIDGLVAINPANNEEVPIFIADYVLYGYGTGAIMAVPAHDERDYEFAKKFNIEIREVISGGDIVKEAYVGDGSLVNSGKFNGLSVDDAKKKITKFVKGKLTTNYRLRDWSISRQRYWGCPIPIVYSPEGEAKFVGEENLPWLLPDDVDFVPTGESPLKKSKELKKRTEDIFGKGWTPEVDTMDTFVDSSWYFLRYPDTENEKEFCSKKKLEKWFPVDLYIGGAEHTYMHLLYARFFVKAMKKIGLINFDEPFKKLRHQGMILDESGEKMSKSKGNVINPNNIVDRFGADATRMYMMFIGPLEDDVLFKEDGAKGVYRFLEKVWKIFSEKDLVQCGGGCNDIPKEIPPLFHKTIKKVTDDIESLDFNTAISQLMIFVNEVAKHDKLPIQAMKRFLVLLSPFAPHISEELWEKLGGEKSIFLEEWPKYNPDMIKDKEIKLVVQINGKVRDNIIVDAEIDEDGAMEKVMSSEKAKKWIENKEIVRVVFVSGKLINVVVR